MKTFDSNEFYNAKFENKFNEFKSFKAEQYYSTEKAPAPVENVSVEENFNEVQIKANKKKAEELNSTDLRKELDKLNSSQQGPSETTSTSTTSSTSASSAGSSTAHAVAETASTAAGTAASVTVTVAAVAVTGVVGGLIDEPPHDEPEDPQISLNLFYDAALGNAFTTGSDYVVLSINKSDMLMDGDSINDSYQIEVFLSENKDNGVKVGSIELENGKDEYLLTGLSPNTAYTYEVNYSKYINPNGKKRAFEPSVTRYKNTFTSIDSSGPAKLVLDKNNTVVTFDEVNHFATINYSVYLSNYDETTNITPMFTVTKDDTDYMDEMGFFDMKEEWDENHFFKGQIKSSTREKLYFNAFGGEDYNLTHRLDSIEYLTGIPKDYASYHLFTLSDDQYVHNYTNHIDVYGTILDYRDDFDPNDILCELEQFDETGESMGMFLSEADFELSTMSYWFGCPAAYGVKSARWRLMDSAGTTILMESEVFDYDADQSYSATFQAVPAKDVSIVSYDDIDSTATIEIDTQFNNHYDDAFLYRVEALDADNNVLATYEGTDPVIDLVIPQSVEFELRYTKIGDFALGRHVYGTELANGTSVAHEAKLALASEPIFDGTHWVIPYTCDSIYNYQDMSAVIEIDCDLGHFEIEVSEIESTGSIVLDCLDGEPGATAINGQLRFRDSQTYYCEMLSEIERRDYMLEWKLEIKRTIVNLTPQSYYSAQFDFEYIAPSNFSITLMSSTGESFNTQVTDSYTAYCLDGNDCTMTARLVNDNGVEVIAREINIQPLVATANQSNCNITTLSPNPGDSVVTYNDDGTINVYRKMDAVAQTPNTYYDAALVHESVFEDSVGTYVDKGVIHNISDEKFSVIEGIDLQYYSFRYYKAIYLNDVYYLFDETYPSGGIEHGDSWYISGLYDSQTNKTELTLTMNSWSVIENWYEIDGVEYQFDSFTAGENDYTIIVDGDARNKELKVRCARYGDNYDAYAQEIEMKGSRYRIETYELIGIQSA